MSKRFIVGVSCLQLVAVAALLTAVTANEEGLRFCCEKISSDAVCNDTCIQTLSPMTLTLSSKQIQALSSACSPSYTSFWTCIDETVPTVQPSLPEYYYCCAESPNVNCRQGCREALAAASNSTEYFSDLTAACGTPPADPVWTCILAHTSSSNTHTPDPSLIPEQPPYADWARVQCCYKAVAKECKDSCLDLYSGRQIYSSTWSTFQLDCIHRPSENVLATCLSDVSAPCKLGCSGLQFCSSFNNRPTMSFRHCTATADRMAKNSYYSWVHSSVITHPLVTLFVNRVDSCFPDLWQTVACITHVQPCHTTTHATQICRRDCMKLLSACSTKGTSVAVCDIIAPPSSEEYCISLDHFSEPSQYNTVDIQRVTNPCTPNPCAEGYFCAINHRCQGDNPACESYSCQPGCAVGDRPSFVVSEGGGVRVALVTDPERSCYGYFNCSESEGDFSDGGHSLGGTGVVSRYEPVHLHCEMERLCSLNNHTYQHQTTFRDDCNFCTCYYGRVTCTRRGCSLHSDQLMYAGCNCAMLYRPVCTSDGKTIPNACVANCLGYSQYRQGDCSSLDSCGGSSLDTCGSGYKCLPSRRVCISPGGDREVECGQHTCESPEGCVNSEAVCASNNVQHTNLCSFLTTQGEIDYFGYCKPECSPGQTEHVCGVNGETYDSSCHANNAYVAVDYLGPCKDVPGTNIHETEVIGKCRNVVCPQLPPDCVGVLSHDSCCPQCGSHLTLLLDKELLKKNIDALGREFLSSTDMLRKLRYHISSLECELFGHVSYDDSLSIWVLPTQHSSDNLMVEACNAEAVKLATFINNHTPMFASDPILSHLVAAEVATATFNEVTPPVSMPGGGEPAGAGLLVPSVTMVTLLLILSLLF